MRQVECCSAVGSTFGLPIPPDSYKFRERNLLVKRSAHLASRHDRVNRVLKGVEINNSRCMIGGWKPPLREFGPPHPVSLSISKGFTSCRISCTQAGLSSNNPSGGCNNSPGSFRAKSLNSSINGAIAVGSRLSSSRYCSSSPRGPSIREIPVGRTGSDV